MTATEVLARIDAEIEILSTGASHPGADTLALLCEARALIPEPPTDNEREALDSVIRGALAPLHIDYTPWHRIVTVLLDAILASPVWRNRHRGPITDEQVERICEVMHDAYEEAAVREGWSTQEASRKPWSDVPEPNKRTMRYAVRAALEAAETAR